jgi:hypothetical protein
MRQPREDRTGPHAAHRITTSSEHLPVSGAARLRGLRRALLHRYMFSYLPYGQQCLKRVVGRMVP